MSGSSDRNENESAILLEKAVSCHRAGRLAAAQDLYARILERAPNHFDALHMQGVISLQQGRFGEAEDLISRAIRLNPRVAQAYQNHGTALRALDRLSDALASYEKAISLKPDYAEAQRERGLTLHRLGRAQEALAAYERAIALKPDFAAAHTNRGNVLRNLGRFEEALASHDKAIALRPDYSEAYSNRGNTLRDLKRLDEALASYDSAIALNLQFPDAYNNRGNVLRELKRPQDAVASYDKAIALNSDSPDTHYNRGCCLLELKDEDRAVASFRQAIALNPNFAEARFHIARLTSEGAPDTAPPSYVAELFDDYADRFEDHLVKKLKYSVPEDLASSVLDHVPEGSIDILDLGCGTGLLGPLLVGKKRQLIGIDLSERMIQKAREKGVYDALYVGDMVEFLSASSHKFEAVLAADVFVYVGALENVFAGVRRILVKSGVFAFSVERSSESNFSLSKNGRYSHSRSYVEQLAAASGFLVRSLEQRVTRYERDEEVIGYLVVLEAA